MKIKKALKEIINNNPDSIRAYVAHDILDSDDPKAYIQDLQHGGCISGMVSGLIYYSETHAFFSKHYEEIEDLREELEDSIGEPLKLGNDLKNFLAWFSYEETANRIASDLGIN